MTKKARTILFFICLILFLLVAPSVILYSMGYRVDFDSKKIVQSGGLYFKVWPKGVQIYIDGRLKKKTDFLFGSALIEDLLPKKYKIEIKKEGFHPWKKTLEIKEKQVTELKNVFLIPENPVFTNLTEDVDNFWSSPDGKKIILKTTASLSAKEEESWALKILELENGFKTHLFDEEDLKKEKEVNLEILDLKFSPDSTQILLKIKEDKAEKYFISSTEETPVTLIPLDFLEEEVQKISFNPENPQIIFFSNGDSLFAADFLKKEKNQILRNLITYQVFERNIYFISDDGFLFKTDLSGTIQDRLNSEAIVLNEKAKYQIQLGGKEIFLLENDLIYFLNKNSGKLEKLFEGIKNFEISPDLKKAFFSLGHEIWILFSEEALDQPQKKGGEKLFLTRFSEEITDVFWYTSHYLVFTVGNKIKVAEIDDRDRINIVDLAEFKEPKIFFNRINKKLYVLAEKNLFVSRKLLP